MVRDFSPRRRKFIRKTPKCSPTTSRTPTNTSRWRSTSNSRSMPAIDSDNPGEAGFTGSAWSLSSTLWRRTSMGWRRPVHWCWRLPKRHCKTIPRKYLTWKNGLLALAAVLLAGCASSRQDKQRQLEMMAQHRAGVLSAGLPIEVWPTVSHACACEKHRDWDHMMIYNQDAKGAKPLNQVVDMSVNSFCTNSEVRANLDMGLAYNIKIRNTRGQLMVEADQQRYLPEQQLDSIFDIRYSIFDIRTSIKQKGLAFARPF